MGTNVILAIGALIIFGTVLSSSNRLMSVNTQIAEQNEYCISAISLAQSIIEEAKSKAFDQKGNLAAPDSGSTFLGPDGLAETISQPDTLVGTSPYSSTNKGFLSMTKYTDVDDYNGYKRLVNTQRAEGYSLSTKVGYANPLSPNTTSVSKTFCKLMTVTVKSPYMPDSLTVTYAFIY